MLDHLGRYKSEELKVKEPGNFHYRGQDLEKPHILPKNRARDNLLELVRPEYDSLLDSRERKLKWHRYFHHLNSSQALAVNLFQPFLQKAARNSLLASLLGLEAPLTKVGFEHIPDEREGTNVDFFAEGQDGGNLLVEVKFTERGFGKAKDDVRHRQKYEEVYRDQLRATTLLNENDRMEFFSAYQFFRNAIHAGLKKHVATRVWFLVPRDNTAVRLAAKRSMIHLKSEIAAHVQVIELESFLEEIEAAVLGEPELVNHFAHFRRKYVVPVD
ncbi:MAG: hypothetical protein H0X40_06635 [Chthoniobacterales bacterium]|nr:hypothetical protein [Chthoniobacterales bacterium]